MDWPIEQFLRIAVLEKRRQEELGRIMTKSLPAFKSLTPKAQELVARIFEVIDELRREGLEPPDNEQAISYLYCLNTAIKAAVDQLESEFDVVDHI